MDKYIQSNSINLHYLEKENLGKPIILLMHGLTANAHCFDSFLEGLKDFHILSVNLRGRGLSDKPNSNYTMEDHACDIIGLMDNLHIDRVVIGGHSFGALLSIFIAANYPERVTKVILMDAAARLHPNVKEMVAPAMLRLDKIWQNFDTYLSEMKAAPYVKNEWLPEMLSYYKADVKENKDGTFTTQSTLHHMSLAIEGALSLGIKWLEYISAIQQPVILINATENYGCDAPILPKEFAMETVSLFKNCEYQHVSGNHLTMLFGKGAKESVVAIKNFLNR
tara:strand:+ start:5669 stop:6508 length:840 start_codon:yes stop_codon:yes gene_type:complete